MLTLVRYSYDSQHTLGLLFNNQDYICDTLERPWEDNKRFVSCIPESNYDLKFREGLEYHVHEAYEVQNVEGRDSILIHAANSVSDLQGCIGVGVRALNMLYNSREMFFKLHDIIGDTGSLKIEKLIV